MDISNDLTNDRFRQYPVGPRSMRRKTSGVPKPIPSKSEPEFIDLEEVEDHVKPIYLRDSTIYNAYVKFKEKQEYEELLKMTLREDSDLEPPRPYSRKWQVETPDLNAWKKNTIDTRNIYSARQSYADKDSRIDEYEDDEDSIAESEALPTAEINYTQELPVLAQPPPPPKDPSFTRERSYILETRNKIRSPEMDDVFRFWAQTFNSYNVPTKRDNNFSYGSPRYKYVRETSKDSIPMPRPPKEPEVEKVTRIPGHLKILPRLLRADACQNSECTGKQFCDVLGPETCRACMEFARRKVGQEMQKIAFPNMDYTATAIVAPELAKCSLLSGDAFSSRSRSRKSSRWSSTRNSLNNTSLMKLPSISEHSFGRAGVERDWERRARKFSTGQSMDGMLPFFA